MPFGPDPLVPFPVPSQPNGANHEPQVGASASCWIGCKRRLIE
jgi:hypothetical protein